MTEQTADEQAFLTALKAAGGSAGNKKLRDDLLKWSDNRYWPTHKSLFEKGLITKGRGKGGSVISVDAGDAEPGPQQQIESQREIELYEGCLQSLRAGWLKERSYDDSVERVTAKQGRRNTGGTWTRPDITIVGRIRAEHYPIDQVEYVTFEVKKGDDISVMAVYEALSHQKAATHSYCIFYCRSDELEKHEQYRRIMAAASEHGIGIILLEDPLDPDGWDEWLEGRRTSPSPVAVDKFIGDAFTEVERKKIRSWRG